MTNRPAQAIGGIPSSLHLFFGFHGRIGQLPFAVGLAAVVAMFALGIQGSLAALPWLAEVLAPRGINAGFALNAIWSLLTILLVWSLLALGAKRLRDRGHSPWWAAAAVLPLQALALLNDAIFLVSRAITLPRPVEWAVLLIAGGIGIWVLWECLLRPASHDAVARVTPTPS